MNKFSLPPNHELFRCLTEPELWEMYMVDRLEILDELTSQYKSASGPEARNIVFDRAYAVGAVVGLSYEEVCGRLGHVPDPLEEELKAEGADLSPEAVSRLVERFMANGSQPAQSGAEARAAKALAARSRKFAQE